MQRAVVKRTIFVIIAHSVQHFRRTGILHLGDHCSQSVVLQGQRGTSRVTPFDSSNYVYRNCL